MTALYQKVLYDTGVPRNVRILEKTESAVFEKLHDIGTHKFD